MKQNKYEGLYLTNGRSVDDWLNSFSSDYENDLAKKAIDYCLRNGYQLSELKLRLTISSLNSTLPQKFEEPKLDIPTYGTSVVYIDNRRKNKGCLFVILFIMAILVSAFCTNPSLEKHQEILRQRITSVATNDIKNNKKASLFKIILKGYVIDSIVSLILDTNLQYNDYILFSTTSIDIYGGSQELSFGIFGKIFTIPNDEMERIVDEYCD